MTEERLEAVAWETAVQAGCSMPNLVRFVYSEGQKFLGYATVSFPHKEAAELFVKHTSRVLEVDGFNLAIQYHHTRGPGRSRSPSHGRGGQVGTDEPSVTLIIKGIASTTPESAIVSAFQPFATIKDVRHFPRRGFAFVQFHSVDEAKTALGRFERDCRSKLDGCRVMAHFAKEREDGRYGMMHPGLLAKQALATAEAAAEFEKISQQEAQQASANKALCGVNADMWANYLQSVSQTETVQSSNTFMYDKDSGYYLDSKAGLYYDPNTTFFFTTDYKKYFLYDHDEELLCLVDSQGQKVEGGEKRPLPSQAKSRDHGMSSKERGLSTTQMARPRSRSRKRDRSRSRDRRPRGRSRGLDCDGDTKRRRQQESPPTSRDSVHKPIYFPGGDPLAKLAPVPEAPAQPGPHPKKRRKPSDTVLGLVSTPDNGAGFIKPAGPVQVLVRQPGPVQVLAPPPRVSEARATHPASSSACILGTSTSQGTAPAGVPSAAQADVTNCDAKTLSEWICEVCMRKFDAEEKLRRHEQFSELHKQNLAALGRIA